MRTARNQRIYNSAFIPQHSVLVVALCATLFALCLSAEAQQSPKVPRIGYLIGVSPSPYSARTEAFRKGLRELGYTEGKNIIVEWRYGDGNLDHHERLAEPRSRDRTRTAPGVFKRWS